MSAPMEPERLAEIRAAAEAAVEFRALSTAEQLNRLVAGKTAPAGEAIDHRAELLDQVDRLTSELSDAHDQADRLGAAWREVAAERDAALAKGYVQVCQQRDEATAAQVRADNELKALVRQVRSGHLRDGDRCRTCTHHRLGYRSPEPWPCPTVRALDGRGDAPTEPAEVLDRETDGPTLVADDDPVHAWFELSYSNYAVLHRTLMQSMPVDWQRRMVGCLEELRAAFLHIEQAPGYEVQACDWLAPHEMTEQDMRAAGVTVEWPDGGGPVYQDRDGNELDPSIGRVAVPRDEPVPHYNRGRTRIRPELKESAGYLNSVGPNASGVERPEIVVLCGSTRFKDAWYEQGKRLTYEGRIVLSVGDLDTSEAARSSNVPISAELKAALDELHKRKIDLADRVLVLNVGGYVGDSTRSEIAYATELGKPIDYLVPPACPGAVTTDNGACGKAGWDEGGTPGCSRRYGHPGDCDPDAVTTPPTEEDSWTQITDQAVTTEGENRG